MERIDTKKPLMRTFHHVLI